MILGYLILSINVNNFPRCLFKCSKVIFLLTTYRFKWIFFPYSLDFLWTFTLFKLQVDNTCWLIGLVLYKRAIKFMSSFKEGVFSKRDFLIGHVFFIMWEYIFTERVNDKKIAVLIFFFRWRLVMFFCFIHYFRWNEEIDWLYIYL